MFGRKKSKPPVRRQRLNPDGLPVPAPAFSYRTNRSEQNPNTQNPNTGRNVQRESPQGRASKKSTFWLRRPSLLMAGMAALVLAAFMLSLSPQAKVVPVTAGGTTAVLRDTATYQVAANKLLGSSVLNRNKITIDTRKVSTGLAAQFPELAGASITLPLLAHKPVVYIEPAQPIFILAAHNGSFLIDRSGKAILLQDNVAAQALLKLPTVTDQSNLPVTLGHLVVPATSVKTIQAINAQLAAKGFQVTAMALPSAASELDVNLAGQPYFIKFSLQTDNARQQAGTFLATQSQLKKQNITPAHYIDVRVAGRAYYQ